MRKPLFLSVLIAISGCGEDEDIDEGQKTQASISATCARACARAAAAKCADSNVDCMIDCRDAIESSPSSCDRELDAFAVCATKAKFTCDANGEAEAKDCNAQLVAWANCQQAAAARDSGLPGRDSGTPSTNGNDAGAPSTSADSGVPSVPTTDGGVAQSDGGATNVPGRDAGQSDAGSLGTLTCAPKATDDACGTCFKASCCDEIEACGADCFALLDCITECETEACVNACYTTYPDGVDEFSLLASCTEDSCEIECGDEIEPTGDTGVPTADAGNSGSDLSQICLPSAVPEGVCTDPRQPVGHDCPLGRPYADCTLLPDIANVYCCSR